MSRSLRFLCLCGWLRLMWLSSLVLILLLSPGTGNEKECNEDSSETAHKPSVSLLSKRKTRIIRA